MALLYGATLLIASSGFVYAEDLTDNEVCLECHADERPNGAMTSPGAEVHNAEGGFIVEDHEMWSCTDCHADIKEIPHAEDVERAVNCLDCHDAVPE